MEPVNLLGFAVPQFANLGLIVLPVGLAVFGKPLRRLIGRNPLADFFAKTLNQRGA